MSNENLQFKDTPFSDLIQKQDEAPLENKLYKDDNYEDENIMIREEHELSIIHEARSQLESNDFVPDTERELIQNKIGFHHGFVEYS